MISNRNKSLFATVVMAIALARAAPLQDTNVSAGETHLIDAIPEHHIKDAHMELGNHSMHITSPTGSKEHHHHHHHHQTQVVPSGEDYAEELSDEIPSNGEELAEHVINLRDYIDTLSEHEFDAFLDHYLENGSKDDMFALELALDLDADEQDEEDDLNYSDPWDTEDDEDAIKFVPYSQVHGGQRSHHRHHRQRLHNHRLQHRLEQEVGCDEEEIAMGLCEPSLELSRHPRHHGHHHRHQSHHEFEDELCSPADIDAGVCEEINEPHYPRHHKHQGHHQHQPHLRHGEVIEEISYGAPSRHHHQAHQMLTKADGYPFSQNLSHQRHYQHYDADLLGKPDFEAPHASHKPIGFSIIEQAVSEPVVGMVGKPGLEANSGHPVKIAEVHVQEVTPRSVDDEAREELTKRDHKKKHHKKGDDEMMQQQQQMMAGEEGAAM